MKCAKCGFDDNGTGDTAHLCMTQAELKKMLNHSAELAQAKKERDRILDRLAQQDMLIAELELRFERK